jgi:hypothetical protein
LAAGAAVNDIIQTVAFNAAETFTPASPTFTGTLTAPTINASTALQIGGAAVTSTAAELNLLDGVSGLVQADLTKLAAVDATAAELNYVDGVTSNVQTQLNTKAPTASPTFVTPALGTPASGVATNLTGTAASLTAGNATLAATATALATARTIGGVSFNGTANIDLPGVNSAGNQATSGLAATATLATTTTVTDSTANTNFPVVFHDESNALLDDTGALRYNPSTGQLLVPNLTVAGTTTQVDTVTMNAQNAVVFEGATADNYETTLSIVDPTADHTQYLVNQGGYIPVLAAATTTAITSTPEELNILDGVTSTAAELNILDGVTSTAAELNILDGVTSTAAELNILADGTDGELITWDASGVIAAVATGAAAQVLTSNGAGAAPTFQTASGGGTSIASLMAYGAL